MKIPPTLSPSSFRWLFAIALLAMLFFALDPQPPHLPIDDLGDKFEHSLAFAVLTILALLGYPATPALRIAERLSFLGALIEVFQSIPALHRDCDVLDWLTDTIAILAIVAIALVWRRRRPGAAGAVLRRDAAA